MSHQGSKLPPNRPSGLGHRPINHPGGMQAIRGQNRCQIDHPERCKPSGVKIVAKSIIPEGCKPLAPGRVERPGVARRRRPTTPEGSQPESPTCRRLLVCSAVSGGQWLRTLRVQMLWPLLVSGGVAALDPRLMAGNPSGSRQVAFLLVRMAVKLYPNRRTITAEAWPCGVTFRLRKLAPGWPSPLRTTATEHSGAGVV